MAGQIKASYSNMETAEKKMLNLNEKLQNRKLKLNFTNSKGSMVDSMMESENLLNDVKNALCNLIVNTQNITNTARNLFECADMTLAREINKQTKAYNGGKL